MAPQGLRAPALALAGVSLIALLAAPAAAQTVPAAQPAPAAADTTEAPEVVVTGTRIRNADFETANPVVSVNAARIQQSGDVNLTEYLTRLPALTGSIGPSQDAQSVVSTAEGFTEGSEESRS